MSARLPLGAATRTNENTRNADKPRNDDKAKVRSVTDGPKDVGSRDEASRLRMEVGIHSAWGVSTTEDQVEALRARVSRRDETITKLQAIGAGHGAMKDIQGKLQDLMSRHESSKAKHRAELDAVKAENATLRQEADGHRIRETSLAGKLTDVRSKLALSEAETAKLRQEAFSRPSAHHGSVDDRIAWNKAKMGMESEIRKLEKEVERGNKKMVEMEEKVQKDATVRAENERLKFGWAIMAAQYGELYETLQRERKEARCRMSELEGERDWLLRTVDQLRHRLQSAEGDRKNLHAQLAVTQELADLMKTTMEQQSSMVHPHQAALTASLPAESTIQHLAPTIEQAEVETMLGLMSTHAGLYEAVERDSLEHIAHLTFSIIELEQSLREALARLATAESSHALLVTDHETLRNEHAPCAASLSQVRFELDQANRLVDSRGEEVNDVRLELRRTNERSERQADLLQKANENVLRSKFAQDALEEEVEHLRTKFIEAAGFEERYHDLLERQQLLETREAVAIEQAERVAMENAELMGHPNGSQKIGYVDGVRREIALSRQELAATRHYLNVANDRIATLETEIEAYKTISPESMSNSTRTRVVRRQPEGGRLTTSLSASGMRRISVTGPGGAKRLI